MKAYPQLRVIYDRKHKATRQTAATVELVVSYESRRAYFSTGVKVCAHQWRNGVVVAHPDADILNSRIHDLLQVLDERVRSMWKDGTFSIEGVKGSISQCEEVDIFAWIQSEMEARPIRPVTRRLQLTALRALKECRIFTGWIDFTPQNMMRWTEWLKQNTGAVHDSSIHNYHKRIKPYIKKAMFLGYIKSDPYAGYTVPRGDNDRPNYLEIAERDALIGLELTGTAEHVRDVFIFCCYTSLAWVDVANLSDESYVHEDGKVYVQGTRQKTGTAFKNILLDIPRGIAEKYDYKLPVISNQKMNVWLKALAVMAGINKNLTTHMARHTFGTWAVNQSVPLELVSKMMGHRSLRETQRYAKIQQDTVDAALMKLNGK